MSLSSFARQSQLTLLWFGLGLLSCAASSVYAAESSDLSAPVIVEADIDSSEADQAATILPTVVVVGVSATQVGGQTILDAAVINQLPIGDGTLAEALTGVPGVQYSEAANSSLTAGEILPPLFSIAGGRVEENTFLLDGFSTDSRLDPLQSDGTSGTVLPGHPQGLFVHSSLLESVTVHDSNISAAYGGFTGGVVDTKLRRPASSFGGELHYRTTRDEWTSFHLAPGSQAAFKASNYQNRQPRFAKHEGGLSLDLPLSRKTGLLVAYQQTFSKIQLLHLAETKTQTRRTENYLLRFGLTPSSRDRLDLTLIYTPYQSELFRKDTKNSDFTVDMGGYLIGADYERKLAFATWDLKAGYTRQVNSREAPQHLMTGWNKTSVQTDWGNLVGTSTSYEGMLGDLEQWQESLQLKSALHLEPLQSGPLQHRFSAGIELERLRGHYDRSATSYNYYSPVLDPAVLCRADDPACLSGDQYLNRRFVFPTNSVTATVQRIATYTEDTLDWGRLQLRPGIRLSYDDFLQNLNTAPRLAAAWDLFGDGSTVLTAGANRYYGQELLTYALRGNLLVAAPLETRDAGVDADGYRLNTWTGTTGAGSYLTGDLKTPHKDEWTVGVQQKLLGGRFDVRFIHRRGVDEFAREYNSVARQYKLNNNGRSRYNGVLASWERAWERHFVNANVTYTRIDTGAPDYMTSFAADEMAKRVWYNNELLMLDELPWSNYSRPWVANLSYVGQFPYGLTFSNLAKFRSHYRRLVDSKLNSPIDGNDIYIGQTQPSTLIFDWRLDWKTPDFAHGQTVVLSLEVYNVFDVRTEVGGVTDEYNLGRQFWLGGNYNF